MPLSGGIVPGKFNGGHQVTTLVCFCSSAFLLYKWGCSHGHSMGPGHLHHIQALSHCTWASWLASSGSIWGSDSSTSDFPSTCAFVARYPLVGTPLLEHPLAHFLAILPKGKWDHSPSDSPNHLHAKRACITSPEVEVGSEDSSTWGDNHTPNLTLEIWTSSRQHRQKSSSPSTSSIRGPANPDDKVVAGSSNSTKDQTSLDSGPSKWNMADFDLDTASGDCLPCSDTDNISIWTARKKYRKRVRASCKIIKGSDWMETQMKRIGDICQDIWGHDHKIARTEWRHALVEDHTSFEMRRMTRTDQLLCIAEATSCKIYTRESEVGTHGSAKALVLSLKQFHAHFCRLYEKGTTRAMVVLHVLHSSNAFQLPNMSASVGLKLFWPWCFKFRGNTEMITTHLREVHYRLDIACNVCWAFASMSVQVDLEHQSRCRAKLHKKSKMK